MEQTEKEKTFREIYEAYHEMVFGMCMGYLKGNISLANDLSQEVFLGVWNALDGFRQEAKLKTWIYRITVNTCLLHIRNHKNKQTIDLTEQFEIIDEKPNDFSDLYYSIGKLPEVERIIIMLVLDEVDYNEISEIVGIKEGNLRVKIHRIKKKLNELMQQHGR